jgi:hypothetical protein
MHYDQMGYLVKYDKQQKTSLVKMAIRFLQNLIKSDKQKQLPTHVHRYHCSYLPIIYLRWVGMQDLPRYHSKLGW